MPSAEARIPTDRAARYLEQLCSHLGAMAHMRHLPATGHGGAGVPRVEHVEQGEDRAVIHFAAGSWQLTANEDALVLRVDADDVAALEQLKTAIAARIAKIGRRDGLSVAWASPTGPLDGPGAGSGAGARPARRPGRRGRWRWFGWFGWFALAAAAIAVHLGLIGSLLGAGRWKQGAADAIIALIAVKLVLLVLHARLGRGRPHAPSRRDAARRAGPETRA